MKTGDELYDLRNEHAELKKKYDFVTQLLRERRLVVDIDTPTGFNRDTAIGRVHSQIRSSLQTALINPRWSLDTMAEHIAHSIPYRHFRRGCDVLMTPGDACACEGTCYQWYDLDALLLGRIDVDT